MVNDVTAQRTLEDLVGTIENTHGPIDILVNNAGINMKKPAVEATDEEFDRIVHTNLNAVFSLTPNCAKRMLDRQLAPIIMITSMAVYYGIDRVAAYGASEWLERNVRINAIAPGFIEMAMSKTAMSEDPERFDQAMCRTPMGTFGKPDDIGWAVVFKASDAARYITRASLPVDGGNSIGF